MLRYRFLAFLGMLFLVILNSCSTANNEQQGWNKDCAKLKVLCTIEMIRDLVQQIGQEYIETRTLIQGDLNPHIYEFVKGDSEKLSTADIVFYNGLGLEHSPSLVQHLHQHTHAIGLGNTVLERFPERILFVGQQPDPHIWMDISLWQELIDPIVIALTQQDPIHAEQYQLRGDLLKEQFIQSHQKVYDLLQQIPSEQRYLVSSHDAFHYFAKAYLAQKTELITQAWRIRCVAPEGLSPESQISPGDIQQIIDHLVRYKITTLFTESNVSKDSLRKILDAGNKKGMHLLIAQESLYGDAMGKNGSAGESYLKMIEYNAKVIAKGLGCSTPLKLAA